MDKKVTINGIPVYDAIIGEEGTGMTCISLVDEPAVMSDFVAMAKASPRMMYAVESEEKRLVFGVVMRADFPLYRRTDKGVEYYIIYRAATIRAMAEQYLEEGLQNKVNLMHKAGMVEGVQMVQWFLKDSAKGLNPDGFEDIADGSLFAEFHVTNDDVWKAVKDGTYKGFSLEGYFDFVPETDVEQVKQDVREAGEFRKITNFIKQMKLSKIKAALARILAQFGSVTTDKGVLVWEGDEDLKAGDAVSIENAEGEVVTAEDGEYKTEDGKTIVVVGGEVSEIKDPEAEVSPEEFGKVNTDKGELQWDGDEDLKAGDAVYVEQDGERVAAPDGDYVTEDDKVITVKDGVVEEIADSKAEVAARRMRQAFELSYNDKFRKIAEAVRKKTGDDDSYVIDAGDNFAVYSAYDEETEIYKYFRVSLKWDGDEVEITGEPTEVKQAFVPLDYDYDKAVAETTNLRKQVATLKKQPLAKPAKEVVKTTEEKFRKTGNKGLDNLARKLAKQ